METHAFAAPAEQLCWNAHVRGILVILSVELEPVL